MIKKLDLLLDIHQTVSCFQSHPLSPGLGKLSWADQHIKDWFVRVCRGKCQEVYDIVLLFKENNEKINLNCARIRFAQFGGGVTGSVLLVLSDGSVA